MTDEEGCNAGFGNHRGFTPRHHSKQDVQQCDDNEYGAVETKGPVLVRDTPKNENPNCCDDTCYEFDHDHGVPSW
jgi:hypothetical protein